MSKKGIAAVAAVALVAVAVVLSKRNNSVALKDIGDQDPPEKPKLVDQTPAS